MTELLAHAVRRMGRAVGLIGRPAVLVVLLCLVASSAVRAQAAVRPQATADRYLRFVDDDRSPRLETSVLSFETEGGVRVDLIGVVHIGDRAYYQRLNEMFKDYDVVLYELVKPRGADAPRPGQKSKNFIHMLQRLMQEVLELEFQLDHIDYTAGNFVHADLDAETFAQKQAERGENMLTMMLNQILRDMGRPQGERAQGPSLDEIIAVLESEDRALHLKRMLARQFGEMEATLNAMEGTVILDERNKVALRVLREQMDQGRRRIAIFYGAAHLPGMDELMVDLMGFERVGEPKWLTAWDLADPK